MYLSKNIKSKLRNCGYTSKSASRAKDRDEPRLHHDQRKRDYDYEKHDYDYKKRDYDYKKHDYDHEKRDYGYKKRDYDYEKRDYGYEKRDYGYENRDYDERRRDYDKSPSRELLYMGPSARFDQNLQRKSLNRDLKDDVAKAFKPNELLNDELDQFRRKMTAPSVYDRLGNIGRITTSSVYDRPHNIGLNSNSALSLNPNNDFSTYNGPPTNDLRDDFKISKRTITASNVYDRHNDNGLNKNSTLSFNQSNDFSTYNGPLPNDLHDHFKRKITAPSVYDRLGNTGRITAPSVYDRLDNIGINRNSKLSLNESNDFNTYNGPLPNDLRDQFKGKMTAHNVHDRLANMKRTIHSVYDRLDNIGHNRNSALSLNQSNDFSTYNGPPSNDLRDQFKISKSTITPPNVYDRHNDSGLNRNLTLPFNQNDDLSTYSGRPENAVATLNQIHDGQMATNATTLEIEKECRIVVLDLECVRYAEHVAKKLNACKVRGTVSYLEQNIHIDEMSFSMCKRGYLHAIFISLKNKEDQTVTLHRYKDTTISSKVVMPIDRAILDIVERVYERKQAKRAALEKTNALMNSPNHHENSPTFTDEIDMLLRDNETTKDDAQLNLILKAADKVEMDYDLNYKSLDDVLEDKTLVNLLHNRKIWKTFEMMLCSRTANTIQKTMIINATHH